MPIACNKTFADEKHGKHSCLRPKDHDGACECYMCGRRQAVESEPYDERESNP